MPLFMSRLRAKFWDGVLDQMDKKLVGQKCKLLTYATRILLIKTTLSSILMYNAFIFKIPIATTKEIDAKCKKFLWNSTPNQRKFSLVKWDKVCREKMKGGLGLRKMRVLNQALRSKLVWKNGH